MFRVIKRKHSDIKFIRQDSNYEYIEVLRMTEDDEILMRTTPEFGEGKLVRVLLATHEVDRLKACREPLDAIETLAGIIARIARPQ